MQFIYFLFFFKVVHNVGLCIALWDLIEIKDSYLFPGDGASHTVGKWYMEERKENETLYLLFWSNDAYYKVKNKN